MHRMLQGAKSHEVMQECVQQILLNECGGTRCSLVGAGAEAFDVMRFVYFVLFMASARSRLEALNLKLIKVASIRD